MVYHNGTSEWYIRIQYHFDTGSLFLNAHLPSLISTRFELFSVLGSRLERSLNWSCCVKCTGFTYKGQLTAKEVDICKIMNQGSLNLNSVHWTSSFIFDPLEFKGSD